MITTEKNWAMGKCAYFRNLLTGLLLFFVSTPWASAQSVLVKDSVGTTTLSVELVSGNIQEVSTKTTVYTTKGNLIFAGNSDKKDDILFMLKGTDVFAKKSGTLILKSKNETVFTFNKGKVWLGNSMFNSLLLIGNFENNNNHITFSLADTKSVLFQVENKLSAAQLMAVLTYFVVTNKIDEQLLEAAKQAAPPQSALGSGTIRRLWGAGGNEDFIWDGKILKNRWGFNDYEQWAFDGTNLYRAWYDTGDDFVWDGTTLQRKWGVDNNVFVKDGNSIRAVYGSSNDEFFIQGNIVKRAWVATGSDEWEINGDIPIPIIMMIVFRLVR
jgi:hypothetical protein